MKKTPLEPEKYYHIYNHAINKQNIFSKERNYTFFLEKYGKYIPSVADTFAYCLMPNHFHLAIRVEPENEIYQNIENQQAVGRKVLQEKNKNKVSNIVSHQFSRFFSSYAQAFNRQENRKGTLFEPGFERKLINSDEYFKELIHYIHYNPVHHKFVKDMKEWKHSSFLSFFSEKPSRLQRKEVIDWFGDKENFYFFHQKRIDPNMPEEFEGI